MARAAKCRKRRQRELRVEQRHVLALVEVAAEPPKSCPLELRRLVRRVQQDKLESFLQVERELPRGRLRDHDVAALDRAFEDDSWMPCAVTALPGGRTAGKA